MIHQSELLIIIPAKSKSSELKNKNLKKIFNHPLFSYSLEAAKRIKIQKKILCSTDSKKISKISDKYQVKTPFLRPKKFSLKLSRDIEFVNHAIQQFYKKGVIFKYGLILRPTSPIRTISTLNKAFKKFKKGNFDSLRAVTRSKENVFKTWVIKNNKLKTMLKSNIKEHYNAPRQILPKTYYQTGNFEYFKINLKKRLSSISGNLIGFYEINGPETLDIDNSKDFKLAFKYLKNKKFINIGANK